MKAHLTKAALAAIIFSAAPAHAFIGQSLAFTAGEMSTPMQHYQMQHLGCNVEMLREGMASKVQVLQEQIHAARLLNVPEVEAALVEQLSDNVMVVATRQGCTRDQAASLIEYFRTPTVTAQIEPGLAPSAQ